MPLSSKIDLTNPYKSLKEFSNQTEMYKLKLDKHHNDGVKILPPQTRVHANGDEAEKSLNRLDRHHTSKENYKEHGNARRAISKAKETLKKDGSGSALFNQHYYEAEVASKKANKSTANGLNAPIDKHPGVPKNESVILEGQEHEGTPHVHINSFASRPGLGIQLTQSKRLPNDKRPASMQGGYVQFPKKEIPVLIKRLQDVAKERN